MGAYNIAVTFFDALCNDVIHGTSSIIPEDFSASRDLQITTLIVLSNLSSTFLGPDLYRKTEFIQSVLLSSVWYIFTIYIYSSGLKLKVIYYLLPKLLAEIAEAEGITPKLEDLWGLVILRLKTHINEEENSILSFYTSFRTYISGSFISESQMYELFKIGKENQYIVMVEQSYSGFLNFERIQGYISHVSLQKESEIYNHAMSLIISQTYEFESFENLQSIIQTILQSTTSSAEKINAVLLVATVINGHSLCTPKILLRCCQILVELISGAAEPKLMRISCWALGKIFSGISSKRIYLGEKSLFEPKDFSRLNENQSIVRLAFDRLCSIQSEDDFMFLESLININIPLPRVDWFKILENIATAYPDFKSLALKFAAKHSFLSESSSLASYFSQYLSKIGGEEYSFMISIEGIGNLLLLAGFSKTKDFSFSPMISHTECIENVRHILKHVFKNGSIDDKV